MKRSVTSDSRGCRRRRESIRGQKLLKAESHSQYHPLPPPCLYLALSLKQVPSLSALSHLPSHTNGSAPAAAAMCLAHGSLLSGTAAHPAQKGGSLKMVKVEGGSELQLAEAGRQDDPGRRSQRRQYLPSL